jgi:hypothetical protein
MDLPVMRECGLAIAVANARAEVKAEAHYITPHAGGDGALRDATEYILKAQGRWKQVVNDYIPRELQRKAKTKAKSQQRTSKNPSVVCLGRARVDNRWATVSPYSPCCFQESLLE